LEQQVASVNKVQRLWRGKEVNLYTKHHGVVARHPETRFENQSMEVLLATVQLSGRGSTCGVWRAEVWLVEGYLFQIMFDHVPPRSRCHLDIHKVTVWIDPTVPAKGDSHKQRHEPLSLPDWIAARRVTDATPPLAGNVRLQWLERIDAALPADYLELTQAANGLTVDGWRVHGPTEVREVAGIPDNYYVLAEEPASGIVVVRRGGDRGLYLLGNENDSPQSVGLSLRDALDRIVELRARGEL